MRKTLLLLLFLVQPVQPELRLPQPAPPLPFWADPAPREIPSGLIINVLEITSEGPWFVRAADFSDYKLAAILSRSRLRIS